MCKLQLRHVLIALCSLVSESGQTGSDASWATTHVYFIAADEVEWDYTPRGRNLSGIPRVEGGSDELAENTGASGVVVRKAIYREYTDATFSLLKARPPEWEHLGILGPLIRAEVGDTIRVIFKNNTKIICTMHPHGLAYDKNSEGALYSGGRKAMDPGNTKNAAAVRREQCIPTFGPFPNGQGPVTAM